MVSWDGTQCGLIDGKPTLWKNPEKSDVSIVRKEESLSV
jgi:hypothetical protein